MRQLEQVAADVAQLHVSATTNRSKKHGGKSKKSEHLLEPQLQVASPQSAPWPEVLASCPVARRPPAVKPGGLVRPDELFLGCVFKRWV